MSTHTLTPRIVAASQATVYDNLDGEKMATLLSGPDTGGAVALMFDETPPDGGPPLHIHHNEDEIFYILEGALDVQVGDERFTITAGSAAFLPRGVPHAFANHGAQTARTLVVLSPAGLERFFAEVEPLVTQAEPDLAAIAPIAAKYGVEIVGPPLTAQTAMEG